MESSSLRSRSLLFALTSLFTLAFLFPPAVLASPPQIPVPFISGISPVSVVPGSAAFTLTINGGNFRPCSSMVYWGTTLLTPDSISTGKITVTIPAALVAAGGTGWITVQNTGNPVKSNVAFLPIANPSATLKFAEFDFPAGDNPLEVAQADVNGDGKLDLITSNYSNATISVFLGNGDGTFQPQVTYAVSGEPFGIVAGDFNGDGFVDLAVGHDYGNQSLDILLNNGDGTFKPAQAVSIGAYEPLHPSVADMNGDGKLDLVVPDWGGLGLYIALGNGDGTFQAPQQIDSSNYSWNVAIADFNEDGVLDLATSSYDSEGIKVYFGNGDGTFAEPQSFTASNYAFTILAADMNGDGHADLVVGSQEDATTILLGNGDGTFQPPIVTSQQYNYAEDVGDFNGDGHLDIITAGNINTLLYLGNGDGTLQNAQTFSNNGFSYGVVAGPFASGGGLGFATTNFSSGKLVVLLQTVSLSPSPVNFGNQATGSTSGPQVVTVTNSTSNTVNITGISFTDANAGDFAQTNNCGSSLTSGATCTINVTFTPGDAGSRTATLNFSDDAPASPQTVSLTGTGVSAAVAVLSPTSLAFDPQLVGSSSLAKTATLQNTGNIALTLTSIQVTGANSNDFVESDNCGVSVAPTASCTISVTFVPVAIGVRGASLTLTDNASDSPQSITLGGTGIQAAALFSPTSISFGSQNVGSSSSAQSITVTSTGSSALLISNIVASGDFTQTNNCPISLLVENTCTIQVTFAPTATGARTGNLTVSDSDPSSPQTIPLDGVGTLVPAAVPYVAGISPVSVAPGGDDLTLTVNGAGFIDRSVVNWNGTPLATTFVSSTKLTAVIPAALTSAFGTGAVTVSSSAPAGGVSNLYFFPVSAKITPLVLGSNSYATGNGAAFLAQGDFNGDGKLDLVSTNNADGTISVFLGNGDGTFQPQQTYPAVPGVAGVTVGDVNGDGKLDIVVGQEIQNNVCDNYSVVGVLLGNGDGTFQPAQTFTAQEGALFPILGDLNGDGKLDIAVANENSKTVSILLGNGDGTFQASQTLTATFQGDIVFTALGDFNGDGKLDLLVSEQETGTLYEFLGNGDGTFQTPQTFATGNGALGMNVADLNGDGKLDIAVANTSAATVSILLGNGDGTFQEPQTIPSLDGPLSIASGDVDGDGKLDLVVGYIGSNGISFLPGNGDGTFGTRKDFAGSSFSFSLIAGNYATNLGLGLATTNFGTSQLSIIYPSVAVSPAALDFGGLGIGSTSAPQSVTFTNPTLGTVNLSNVALTGDNNTDFAQTNDCTANIASGSSCTFNITFTPQALGARAATLSLTDSAFGGTQTVALTGSSVSATATLSVSTLTFDPRVVGSTSTSQTVTLTNSGNNALAITGVTLTGANTSDFAQTNDCGESVAALGHCTITVTFTPSAAGARGAAVSIASSASEMPVTVSLQGTGQDFSLTLSGAQTVIAGNSATFQLSVTPLDGFNQPVTLTCSGAPSLATCTVTPGSVTPNGTTAANVTITLTTTGKSIAVPQDFAPSGRNPWTGLRLQITLLALALIALLALAASSKKLRSMQPARLLLACAVLVLVSLGMAACGSKHTPSGGTPAGSYTVTITATSGSLSHSSTAQLTVQ